LIMVAVVRKTRATREKNLILVKAGDQVCRMSHWAQWSVADGKKRLSLVGPLPQLNGRGIVIVLSKSKHH